MILITGATGKLGEDVIDKLLLFAPAAQIAGLVRDQAKGGNLLAKGIEIKPGDYYDINSLTSAFRGIDKVLLISTVAFTDGFAQHTNVIDAAQKAGVKHIVFTSVQRSYKTNYIVPWVTESCERTEQYLINSKIDFTIVRNTFYADNLPYWIGKKWRTAGIQIPAGNGLVPYATRSDLAEAVARVLLEKGHEGKIYTLTNEVTYSFYEIANIFSILSGQQINFKDVPAGEFVNRIKLEGFPETVAIFWSQWAEGFKNHYMDEVDSTLETLLKRKPVGLTEFLKANLF